ncbi:MAG: hypothetical protein N4A65_11110 [Cohaesibacter sp.]|jgi:hypothetical protein|nr:hypothetical protein [Cohaesibacter sp.]
MSNQNLSSQSNAPAPQDQSVEIASLAKAWIVLVGFTLLGFALSYMEGGVLSVISPLIIAALILLKSRIILKQYLGLSRSPAWHSMLSSTIFVIMIVCAALLVFI